MNGPIGYIDSGVGGLTVVKVAQRKLPNEQIVYIGDEARMPYGAKSQDQIIEYTSQMVDFLVQQKKIKLLVIACNTATACALPAITKKYQIPIIGVINSGAKMAVQATKNKQIAVIATEATVDSDAYNQALKSIDQDLKIQQIAAPAFVQLVESGNYKKASAQKIVDQTLASVGPADTLVLGCTHFPIIQDLIGKAVGDQVSLIDPANGVIEDLTKILEEQQIKNDGENQSAVNQYFTTGSLQRFNQIANDWLDEKIVAQQLKIVNQHLEEE